MVSACSLLGALFTKCCESLSLSCDCSNTQQIVVVKDLKSKVVRQLPELSDEEKESRVKTIGHLTKRDLDKKDGDQDLTMTRKEYDQLIEKTTEVALYGSHAALLWNCLKMNKTQIRDVYDLQRLRGIGSISDEQFKILEKAFNRYGHEALLVEPRCFSDLIPEYQAIFLDAAKKSKKHLRKEEEPTPWNKDLLSSTIFKTSSRLDLSQLDTSPPDKDPIELDEKRPAHDENVERLLQELTISSKRIEENKKKQFALLRLELLCYINNIPVKKIVGGLAPEELAKIRRTMPELLALQGAMYHIFLSLQTTTVPAELKAQYGFTTPVLMEVKREMQRHIQLTTDFQMFRELANVRVYALAFLFRVAKKFSPKDAVHFNEKYQADEWVSSSRRHTPLNRTPYSETNDMSFHSISIAPPTRPLTMDTD
ncbi:MAG TPA: hypothetical protein VLE89_04015 [Chlamydiales bacterium]|nr:hypothetical protein [Chlamydiales bacterium]